MSDETSTPKPDTVQVAMIKSLRLAQAQERPDDIVLEITTAKGVERFLLPKAAVNNFSQKLAKFNSPAQKPVIQ